MRRWIFVSDGKLFVAVSVTRIPDPGVVIRNSKLKVNVLTVKARDRTRRNH